MRKPHSAFETVLRGGQTVGHTFDMTVEVLFKMFLLIIVPLIILDGWMVNAKMPPAAQVAGLEVLEAKAFRAIGWPMPQQIQIDLGDGITENVPVVGFEDNPWIKVHARVFFNRVNLGLILFAIEMALVGIGAWAYFKYIGDEKIKPRKIRGQEVISAPMLVAEIEAYNAEEAKANQVDNFVPPRLAGVPYPFGTEREHTMLIGAPGTGKSVAINQLLDSVRDRGDKAFVLDIETDLTASHYDEATDIILNPFDARSVHWSPFNDAIDAADWASLAHSIFKDPKSGDPYWVNVSRSIFQWTAYQLSQTKDRNNLSSLLEVLNGDLANLKALLRNTPAAMHFSSIDGARVGSLMSVISEGVEPLIYLHGRNDGFSIREWINRPPVVYEDANKIKRVKPPGFLFMTAPEKQKEALRPLLSFWSELAATAILSRPLNSRFNTWIVLDEFPSIGRIDKLADGPQRFRKFGGCVVLGFQQVSQLFDIYGPDKARTIIGQCKTKLVLGAADFETAEHMSEQLGRTQWRRTDENISYGAHTIRDGVSLVSKEDLEPIYLGEDILNFVKFQGVIRVPNARRSGAFPIAPIMVPAVFKAEKAKGFIDLGRDPVAEYLNHIARRTPIKDGGTEESGDGGPQKPVEIEDGREDGAEPVTKALPAHKPTTTGAAWVGQLEGATSDQAPSVEADTASPTAETRPTTVIEADGRAELEIGQDGSQTDGTDGTAVHELAQDHTMRVIDQPSDAGIEARKRAEEEEEKRRELLTFQALREQAEAQQKNVHVTREAAMGIAGEAEMLGGLETATKSEVDYAQSHQHETVIMATEILMSSTVGGEVSLGETGEKEISSSSATDEAKTSDDAERPTELTRDAAPALGTAKGEDGIPEIFLDPHGEKDPGHHHHGHRHRDHEDPYATSRAKTRDISLEQDREISLEW